MYQVLKSTLLQLQFGWAGHVARMEDTRMPKAVLFGELSTGKRYQGAPKKRYKDQLKRELALAGVPHHSWTNKVHFVIHSIIPHPN